MSKKVKTEIFLIDGEPKVVEYYSAPIKNLMQDYDEITVYSIDGKSPKHCDRDDLNSAYEQVFIHEYKCTIENRDSGCPHDKIFQDGIGI